MFIVSKCVRFQGVDDQPIKSNNFLITLEQPTLEWILGQIFLLHFKIYYKSTTKCLVTPRRPIQNGRSAPI